MNATLSTRPNPIIHPPDENVDVDLTFIDARLGEPVHDRFDTFVARRVGPLDRVALHLGVALIRWGRRPRRIPSRDELILRLDTSRATEQRERMAERRLRLLGPLR